jgi:transcriptional regulator of acetoin/glycerol metabolism
VPSPDDLRARLAELGQRRAQQRQTQAALDAEFAELVLAGEQAGLTVVEMAQLAQVARETVYKVLRDAGRR